MFEKSKFIFIGSEILWSELMKINFDFSLDFFRPINYFGQEKRKMWFIL